jgi:AraC-like DNA-binding protein
MMLVSSGRPNEGEMCVVNSSRASAVTEFSTRDLAAARERASKEFVEHDIQVRGRGDLNFMMAVVPAPRMTLSRMTYGANVRLTAKPMGDCYDFNLLLTGASCAEQNGVATRGKRGRIGVALLPDASLGVDWSADATQYVVKVPRDLLEAHAAKLVGLTDPEAVLFDLAFELESSEGEALMNTIGFMFSEFGGGSLAVMPAVGRDLEALFLTQLLMTVPSQLTPMLRGGAIRPNSSRIRELVAMIDENPMVVGSVAELATISGLSVRAVQTGFRRATGSSPVEFLRHVRLDRARGDLVSGACSSVTETAGRWGFFHLGRFGVHYRERFGELPSETVRRISSRSSIKPRRSEEDLDTSPTRPVAESAP